MITKLEWDSNFFNLKVGELKYDGNSNENDFQNFDLIYLISNEDVELDVPGFENTFSETKVTFIKSLENTSKSKQPIFTLDEIEVNKEQLYVLAYESGKNSRFLLDAKFTKQQFKKLYQTWVDNSINKKFADGILIFFEDNKLKGFATYKINSATAFVGLIAVGPDFQGKGIGAKLLVYLENLLFEQGLKQLTIPTQLSNIQACNFYIKLGYSIKNKIAIKHYWKNDTI